ncbi:MAG: bifunctional UDP-N-acetylmuramoyl-tripeptide:D-alanyl-D-alanine ligase/alanine racemase [Flavobacteriales bacterium]
MKPKFIFKELIACINAKVIGTAQPPEGFTTILTDSRHITDPNFAVFIALPGPRNDGHDYIPDLYKQGFRWFIVHDVPRKKYPDALFLSVKNTQVALQQLATFHRSKFSFPVVGITGSNGKTVVKEWLYELVKDHINTVRSPKSYNSQIGVPLSIFNIREEHELAIIEAGISERGEMKKLEIIIKPTAGILTNILDAHGENFKDDEQKLLEKLKLFDSCEILITSAQLAKKFKKHLKRALVWEIDSTATDKDGNTTISLDFENKSHKITIPFADDSSIENTCHAYCAAIKLGIPTKKLQAKLLELHPLALRLETLEGLQRSTLIADCYSNDLSSLEIALNALKQRANEKPRMVILSSIMQGKLQGIDMYEQVAKMLNNARLAKIILVGQEFIGYKELFPKAYLYNDTKEFLDHFDTDTIADKVVLIKGAREYGFEKITGRLQAKQHKTVLEINLSALNNNVNQFKSILKPNTKLMCMVKAMGYGAGGIEVAAALQQQGIDYLGVAYTDEGVSLRKEGITTPIMVMNPEQNSFETLIKNELESEIYSLQQLDQFIRACIDAEITGFPVHIKLETGMYRLGFTQEQLPQLTQMLLAQPEVRVASIFSHLAGSDNPELDDFTKLQFKRFQQMVSYIEQELGYRTIKHLGNTAAIARFPEMQQDMVRLGIGMYGIKNTGAKDLQEVCTFRSVISQIKTVPAGETVGYNRMGKSSKEMKIGIVPVGYADGLRRSLGNGKGKLWINGIFAPIVGNVCMDMCMVDLTKVNAREGDIVEIFGKSQPIEDFAKLIDTIPYEVLTSVSGRVKRIYLTE